MSEEVFTLKKQYKTGYMMYLTKRDLELDFLPEPLFVLIGMPLKGIISNIVPKVQATS